MVVLGLPGCFYPGDRGKVLEVRVERLAQDQEVTRRRLAETDERVAGAMPKVEEKLAQMTRAMEGLDKAARRSGADIGVQLQKAVEDVQQLRGQVETYLHRIDALEQSLRQLQQDTEQKIAALQGQEAARQAEARRRAEEMKRPDNPKDFLELAASKAKAGDLPLARQLYGELLKKWPKHELSPEAHYALAETYFQESKCEDALAHYGTVLKEHARSARVPDALLHASECFRKLKMNEAERDALEELVKSHPKSEAAKTARARLSEPRMKGGGKK
jgi:tol-pal system protein YbgF